MKDIRLLTNKILEGENIRSVLEVENELTDPNQEINNSQDDQSSDADVSLRKDLINILEKATEELNKLSIKAALQYDDNVINWGVLVPNSVVSKRMLRILEVNDNGTVRCDSSLKFPAPGVANLNKLFDVRGLVSAIERFVKDMQKEFGNTKDTSNSSDSNKEERSSDFEFDTRPVQEKINELPLNLKRIASSAYKAAQKMQRNLASDSSVVVSTPAGVKTFKITTDKVLSGSDNNLFINLNIDGVNLGDLNNKKYERFRKEVVSELADKDIESNFVIDRNNKVWLLGLVGQFPKVPSDQKLNLWKTFDGLIEFK